MKSLLARSSPLSFFGVVVVLFLLSCNGESPTAPPAQPTPMTPPPTVTRLGFVGGYVYTPSGACLPGAVVEVLDGARAGARSIHNDTCQSPWDYDEGYGYSFQDLTVGKVLMRASKEGYHSQEMTFYASSESIGRSNFVLTPE